jgi:hypothetical protein
LLHHKHVLALSPVDPRTVFGLNAGEVERLAPPGIHMRFAEPSLKQGKVGSIKGRNEIGSLVKLPRLILVIL